MTTSTIAGEGPGHVPGTTPYAWPWDGDLDPRRTALVVLGPARGLSMAGSGEGERLRAIADVVVGSGGAVIQVVTAPPPSAPDGPLLGPPLGECGTVLVSRGIDGFYESGLETRLREGGLDHLLVAGAGLETCVHSTMRSANDRGLECLLVLDASLPYDPSLVGSSRSQVEMSGGIFGAVGSAADVLATYSTLPD